MQPNPAVALFTTLPDAADSLLRLGRMIGDFRSDHDVVMLLCESPESALARAMALPDPIDSTAILRTWCASARTLLSHAHASPDRTLLIDADEAAGELDAARQAWKAIGGLPATDEVAGSEQLRPDALERLTAAPLLLGHASAAALWAELQASCRILPAAPPVDPSRAATRLRQLKAESADLRAAQAQSRDHLADALRQLEDAKRQAAEFEQEAQLARLLHQQALDELQEAAARSVLVATVQQERTQLSQELHELRAELANAHADLRQAHAGWQSEISRGAALEDQLSALRSSTESERILWGQRHSELEAQALELRSTLEQVRIGLHDAESRNSALDERCRALTIEHQALLAQLSELSSRSDSEKALCAQRQTDLEAQALELRSTVERLYVELRQAESRNLALDERCRDLALRHERSVKAIREQREQLAETHQAQLALVEAARARQQSEADARIEALSRDLVGERQHASEWRQACTAEQSRAMLAENQLDTERTRYAELSMHEERTRLELAQLTGQLAQCRRDLSAYSNRLEVLTGEHDHLREELALNQERLLVASRRAESMVTREALLEAQLADALEGLQKCRIADAEALLQAKWQLTGSCDFRMVGERNTDPHRELTVRTELSRRFPVANPSFELRLVEHEGRAGLVFFRDQDQVPPLHHWEAHGMEADREFVRIIPTDSDAAATIAHLPPNDWRMILGLTDLLARQPEAAGLQLSRRWTIVARRLALELDGLPKRLRYSTLLASEHDSTAVVILRDVLFGSRNLTDVELRWTCGHRSSVSWVLANNGFAPLAAWPRRADADHEDAMRLAVGDFEGLPADKKRWWNSLPEDDRALVLGLLETLAAAAQQLKTSDQQSIWVRDATALNREARGMAGAVDWRDRIRRVRRSLKL